MVTLYTYFRSSAAYRVRIALNLKGIGYHSRFVHLLRRGGEQRQPAYLKLNPQGLVPALVDGGTVITQSLAIIAYLDERYPQPPLLPTDVKARAYVRSLAQLVACDIHPLNNLRVRQYLATCGRHSEAEWQAWYRHWIQEGFKALEAQLAAHPAADRYCYGNYPTVADICLVPQVYNARRFNCQLDDYPLLSSIYWHCSALKAFQEAAPECQLDAS
ncbi:maleylacetoacetate isomerase [Nitrosococcus oceani]|uniref:maleylacetoacetate isomerase n=1 Tax=Nitrosococcus oceani TaxID=1229 RepID=UPI0004E9004A|nr:maleylacetoacetate isomerase [Nitrosococcus oceani]KFI22523.1 maleylacetoacetate isomerase [Nitrosococcus oceani]